MNFAFPSVSRVIGTTEPTRVGFLRPLARIRYQLVGGLFVVVLLPALLRTQFELRGDQDSMTNAVLGTALAMLVGAYLIRRVLVYPGVQAISFVLPTFAAGYGGIVLLFFLSRIEYSRFQFIASFILAVVWFILVALVEKHYKRPLLAVVPIGDTRYLTELTQADWYELEGPAHVPEEASGVVADLRADLPPAWQKFLACCALKGLPVYHSKLVNESLTGRVQIEHLSENSLASLLPSSIYRKFKHMVDTLGVIAAIPVILPVAGATALLIKLEDGGPVLFRQSRMGFGGKIFTILKFRTMREDISQGRHFTEDHDPRITRIGKYLRRYRLDELPQAWNILRGEMSWIGPRPESLLLSEWYESQIPFYSYRHIVRPGITGWAQVQQGYAVEVNGVTGKLNYDFFYIKHFSPWLDLLIVARTVRTVLTGFGAR